MCTSDWVKPKASVLKGIFGRCTKDVIPSLQYEPPDVTYTANYSITFRASTLPHVHQGKEPLTELFSLEDVSY